MMNHRTRTTRGRVINLLGYSCLLSLRLIFRINFNILVITYHGSLELEFETSGLLLYGMVKLWKRLINRVPKCDVTKILLLEHFYFGPKFGESSSDYDKVKFDLKNNDRDIGN